MLTIRKAGAPSADGIGILLATPELRALNDSWYARAADDLLDPADNLGDDFPVPDILPAPRPEIGKLYFPVTGARRWARADFLMAESDLDALRTALAGTTAVTLAFKDAEDASDTERAFALYLVAARPLVENVGADTTKAEDAWVVTLADARYYWQFAQGTGGTNFASWSALFAAIGTKLGVTVTLEDAVDADYLTPTDRWDSAHTAGVPTVRLLDCAAACVGSRVVNYADGSVGLQRPTSARRTAATDFHTANLGRHLGGGLIPASEVRDGVPADFDVLFYGDPPSVTTTSLFSLSIAAYGSAVGNTAGTGFAWVDGDTALSAGQRTALGAQYARDFYEWQLAPLDAVYAGFTTVPASAFVGHLEYVHHADEGLTCVKRPPENYGAVVRGRSFDPTASSSTALLLVEVTVSGSSHTVKRKTWTAGAVADYSPLTTYTNVHSTTGSTLPVGTLGYLDPIPDVSGDYWISPNAGYASRTLPGLVSIAAQVFQGAKTFEDRVVAESEAIVNEQYYAGSGYAGYSPLTVYGNRGYSEATATQGVVFNVGPTGVVSVGGVYTNNYYGNGDFQTAQTWPGFVCNGPGLFIGRAQVTARDGDESPGSIFLSPSRTALAGVQVDSTHVPPDFGAATPVNLHCGVTLISSGRSAGGFQSPPVGAYIMGPVSYSQQGQFYGQSIYPPGPGDPYAGGGWSGSGAYFPVVTGFRGLIAPRGFGVIRQRIGASGNEPPEVHLGKEGVIDVAEPFSFGGVSGTRIVRHVFEGGLLIRSTVLGPVSGPTGGAVQTVSASEVKTAAAGESYYADDAAEVQFYLSPLAKVGDSFQITGKGTGGWKINQRAGQTIRTAGNATTTGTAGSLAGGQYTTAVVECVTAGTEFVLKSTNAVGFVTLAWA